ncbi:MAG TPA: glycosyltransferase family 2 protein [bacterium]|nr:glycosyltransferase family 2 protein [bacterium]
MDSSIAVSIIIPAYNEEGIIRETVTAVSEYMAESGHGAELIFVDDGSSDATAEIIGGFSEHNEKITLVSYKPNMGRGYALKQGINAAAGKYIITTEADLTWGLDIVGEILERLESGNPDIVIASPYLRGGNLEQIPAYRKIISKYANKIISIIFKGRITMATGMTRGYRAEVFESIMPQSNGKQFHLEMLILALSAGLTILEIPAVLSWKNIKGSRMNMHKATGIIKSIGLHLTLLLKMKSSIAEIRKNL